MCSTKASCLFEVSAVIEKSARVGRPPPFLVPKGGLVRIKSALRQALAIGRERVAEFDAALDAVQHQVHQAEAMRVGHQLDADERVVPLEVGLLPPAA